MGAYAILIPPLIGELLLRKRGWRNKEESDQAMIVYGSSEN